MKDVSELLLFSPFQWEFSFSYHFVRRRESSTAAVAHLSAAVIRHWTKTIHSIIFLLLCLLLKSLSFSNHAALRKATFFSAFLSLFFIMLSFYFFFWHNWPLGFLYLRYIISPVQLYNALRWQNIYFLTLDTWRSACPVLHLLYTLLSAQAVITAYYQELWNIQCSAAVEQLQLQQQLQLQCHWYTSEIYGSILKSEDVCWQFIFALWNTFPLIYMSW